MPDVLQRPLPAAYARGTDQRNASPGAIVTSATGPNLEANSIADHDRRAKQLLARACSVGDLASVVRLLDTSPEWSTVALDHQGSTVLHLSVRHGHLRLTQELLQRRENAPPGGAANVDASDACGCRPLHIACEEDHADLALELICAGADPNVKNEMELTPLHVTAKGNSIEMLRVLVEQGGADVTVGDSANATALSLAAEHGKTEVVDYLLGADPGLVIRENVHGWTALHFAAHGKETRKTMKVQKFAACCRALLEAGAVVDSPDDDKKTPLHRAADAGNTNTIRVLVEARADVIAADVCRWTPLHYAVRSGHLEAMRALIDGGAPVERENPPCLTPLAIATMENQVRACELLVQRKANPNLRAKGLASPMMIARQNKAKHDDILTLFELGQISHHDDDGDDERARAWPRPLQC